jgi:hypothetical protein
MSEITGLTVLVLACGAMAWMVRTLMRHVEDCQQSAAHSHMLAVLERERCQAILAQCQEIRGDCHLAASVAHDAAADAEEYAESAEPFDVSDEDDEEERWR